MLPAYENAKKIISKEHYVETSLIRCIREKKDGYNWLVHYLLTAAYVSGNLPPMCQVISSGYKPNAGFGTVPLTVYMFNVLVSHGTHKN